MSNFRARWAHWNALALVLSLTAPSSWAASLSDIWLAVTAHSPEAASALFSKQAGQHRLEQAKALWRPQVSLGAGVGQMTANNQLTGAHFVAPSFGASNGVDFGTSIRQGNANNWMLEIQQPLINAQLKTQSAQLKTSSQMAELEYASAHNTLMLATVQTYFQWLSLKQQLESLERHGFAVKNLREQAQERFKVGDVAVTDMLEAQAQEQSLEVQKTHLIQQIKNVQQVLTDVTGWSSHQFSDMKTRMVSYRVDSPSNLDSYQQKAHSQNISIRLLKSQLELEQERSKSHQWESQPSLALLARSMQQRVDGHGDFGNSTMNNRQQYVGLQLNIPLYSGGLTSAQHSESMAQIQKLQMDIQAAQLHVDEAIQNQWVRWQSHDKDLAAALSLSAAHQKRLEATQLAYEVGDRSLPDLLRAQAESAQAEVNVYQQRLNVLLNQLSLFALQGPLGMDQLQTLDAQFRLN